MKVAELVCQSCGTVTRTSLPEYRTDTMPRCDCGGTRQVVRVVSGTQPERHPVEGLVDENGRK
jgi:hypothetical protein